MSQVAELRSGRLLAILIVAVVMVPAAVAQAKKSPGSTAQARFAQAADITFREGVHAKLPPHLSTLLGLTQEDECPVMQGMVRTGNVVQGFDITIKNKNDIVLFVVDETAKDQTLYLTSPDGTLRKVALVKAGVGDEVRITDKEKKAFEKEKQFWTDRLASASATKSGTSK